MQSTPLQTLSLISSAHQTQANDATKFFATQQILSLFDFLPTFTAKPISESQAGLITQDAALFFESEQPIFKRLSPATPLTLIKFDKVTPKETSQVILAEVLNRVLTKPLTPANSREQHPLVPLSAKLLSGLNASSTLPGKVIRSTPNTLIMQPTDKTVPQVDIPLSNPRLRPATGTQILLNIDIEPAGLKISWTDKSVIPPKPLGFLSPNASASDSVVRALLTHTPKFVDVNALTHLQTDLKSGLLSPTNQFLASASANKIVFITPLLKPISKVELDSLNSSDALLKNVFSFPSERNQTPLSTLLARLPVSTVSNAKPADQISLNQDIESLLSKVNANAQTGQSEVTPDDAHETRYQGAKLVHTLMRQLVSHKQDQPALTSLLTALKSYINEAKPKSVATENTHQSINEQTEFLRNIAHAFGNDKKTAANSSNPAIIQPTKGEVTANKTPNNTPSLTSSGDVNIELDILKQSTQTAPNPTQSQPTSEDLSLPQSLKRLLTQAAIFSASNLTQSSTNKVGSNDMITALLTLFGALAKQRSQKTSSQSQVSRPPPTNALVTVAAATAKPRPQAKTDTQGVQHSSENPLLKQIGQLLATHQNARLTSIESQLSGQEQVYYILPGGLVDKHPIEFLIQRYQEQPKDKREQKPLRSGWQLTMKLSIGQLGEVLARTHIIDKSLNIALYAEQQTAISPIKKGAFVFAQRLTSLGFDVEPIGVQKGKVPSTLNPNSLQYLEVIA